MATTSSLWVNWLATSAPDLTKSSGPSCLKGKPVNDVIHWTNLYISVDDAIIGFTNTYSLEDASNFLNNQNLDPSAEPHGWRGGELEITLVLLKEYDFWNSVLKSERLMMIWSTRNQ